MKNKIDTLIKLGVKKKVIADALGVHGTAITNYAVGKSKERILDNLVIEMHNELLKLIVE
ncbi:hypothetical protein CHL78_012080 [Romboutsia weinsteinii]|uniref:Uncharacterized protein n=1 Tax=Romboutsia weinsteinii TaxID=2020949 RepID=A0A371J1W3_9FIRM|nr:hypothetical protein [Romboutsia weinsteinii]RDY26802.1 hypothetical protein CHL78_012080 [Romboutsia weinsteinii]